MSARRSDATPSVVVYGPAQAPFVTKVGLALRMKRLPYEVVEPKEPEDFRRWNPETGLLPVMDCDGTRVAHSERILDWLDEHHPELFQNRPDERKLGDFLHRDEGEVADQGEHGDAVGFALVLAGQDVGSGFRQVLAAPEFHALDFWIGHWRVETPKGEHAGVSHVEPVLAGCVLLEHWKGIFLTTGKVHEGLGVHRYDRDARMWRQAWVDETGASLDMMGEADADGVTYREPDPGDGSMPRGRVARLGDRQAEQYAERRDYATGAWTRTFHLIYSPTPAPGAPPSAPAPGSCVSEAHRALDFWVGQWRVTTSGGQPVGRNRIEQTLSGCALIEHWRGYSPQLGREQDGLGVHRYDAATQAWRQAWMVDSGTGYDLVGRVQGDGLVYERRGADGQVEGRTTLTKQPDGRVRQLGERRDAASGDWQVAFDFIYAREQ